jgi:C1A family cysteine protease
MQMKLARAAFTMAALLTLLCGAGDGPAFAENSKMRFSTKRIAAMRARQIANETRWRLLAMRYLGRNPARREIFVGRNPLNRRRRQIELPAQEGGGAVKRLASDRTMLMNLGQTVEQSNRPRNLNKVYGDLHSRLPDTYTGELPTADVFKAMPLNLKRAAIRSLGSRVYENLPAVIRDISDIEKRPLDANFIGDCTAETGYQDSGEYGEWSDRCAVSEYDGVGILANLSFPLRNSLTCVKDQGQRASCVIHSILGAVETIVKRDRGEAVNLSEQYAYYYGLLTTNFSARYEDDGVGTGQAVTSFIDNRYRIQYESIWGFNRSRARSDSPSSATHQYTDSCVDYTGEMCTEYAFQAQETVYSAGSVSAYVYSAPSASSSGFMIKDAAVLPEDYVPVEVELGLAAVLLQTGTPLIVATSVTEAFYYPSHGYVEYDAADAKLGGHEVLLVGFIPNEDLPAGAPPAAEMGYFVVKNSWGKDEADCGFYYISYAYFRRMSNGFRYFDNDVY